MQARDRRDWRIICNSILTETMMMENRALALSDPTRDSIEKEGANIRASIGNIMSAIKSEHGPEEKEQAMKWFRKKPVMIRAEQVTNLTNLPFKEEASYNGSDPNSASVYDCLHDTWVAFKVGDWIIKGLKGEFYPCVDEVFRASYDELTIE